MSHDSSHGDSHDAAHDLHDSPEVIRKHRTIYTRIFGVLAVMTFLTVAVAYIHLPLALGIVVALIIASFKGGLVAGFFMHLVGEVKAVWWTLWLTLLFFIVLMAVPLLTENDNVGHSISPAVKTISQIDADHKAHEAAEGHGEAGGDVAPAEAPAH